MGTNQSDLLRRIQEAREGRAPTVLESLTERQTATARERADELNDEAEGGFFSSLVKGAAVGALEPLGFLPPVSSFLDAHVGQERPHMGQKIGYALGWIGGTVLPATAALKVGSMALRGAAVAQRAGAAALGDRRIRQLIASADAVADLGLRGNLLRGGIAGALLGAGRDAEDGGDRLRNIATEAAFFGIGDAVMHPVMKAIAGASFLPSFSRNFGKLEEVAQTGLVQDVDGAQIMARAHRLLDEMIPEDAAAGNMDLAARKTAMRLGVSRLGLQDLAPGETRIIPSLRADGEDVSTLLGQLRDQVDFRIFPRKSRGVDTADVLVAPKGTLDDKLAAVYKQNLDRFGVGFFPGQMVRYKGADRVITGLTKGGDKIWTYLPGTGASSGSQAGRVAAKPEELVFLPHGTWRSGPAAVPGAAGKWVKFLGEHGEFPENFENAFRLTVEREGLDQAQAADLHEYFVRRMYENLERVDKSLGDVLKKLRDFRPEAHPDGELAEIGAQTGYVVGHDVLDYRTIPTYAAFDERAAGSVVQGLDAIPETPTKVRGLSTRLDDGFVSPDDDLRIAGPVDLVISKSQTQAGKWRVGLVQAGETAVQELETHDTYASALATFRGLLEDSVDDIDELAVRVLDENPIRDQSQLVTTLRNARDGSRMTFATDKAALAYMRENPLRFVDLTDGIPSAPLPHNSLGFQGASVMPDHTAVDLANARVPWALLAVGSQFLPRLAWFRMMDDNLLSQGIETNLFATASKLQQRMLLARDQRQPWVERLTKMRVKGIRDEKLPVMRDALLRPSALVDDLVKSGDLNAIEGKTAKDLKQYMRDLIEDINNHSNFQIDADTFMEDYLPYIVSRPPSGEKGRNWKEALEASFEAQGRRVNQHMVRFAEEMERAGINPGRHELNPFMVALRWTTTTFTKRHVDEAFNEARALLESLPREGVGDVIRRSFEDGIKVAYGGTTEAYYVTRVAASGYFENLGIKLESKDFDRIVSSLVSMNYGAFMAFRPALAVRNLTQLLVTTLPMIQSPKHMAEGLRKGFSEAGMEEAFSALAIPRKSLAAPFEDMISRDALHSALARASEKPALAKILPILNKGQQLAHTGLGGEVQIAGKTIKTGWYGWADEVNRSVAYHAQKSKTMEALNRWGVGSGQGHGNITRFNEEAGLTQFGEAITGEFHKKLRVEGTVEAVKWLGVQMANETQWVYQMGAGPAAFSQGIGRLFGMFGTWPSWYIQHLIRGANRGTARDKARFWGWSAAMTAAFTGATYATGINFSKWSPLSSLTWTGGPAVDWFADWRDIVSGAAAPGEQPTAKRALALGERGLRDSPDRVPVPFLGHLDPREGMGLDVEDPYKMGRDVLYLFTPGAAQVRDIIRSREEPTVGRAILRATGFQPVAGHAWPEIQMR